MSAVATLSAAAMLVACGSEPTGGASNAESDAESSAESDAESSDESTDESDDEKPPTEPSQPTGPAPTEPPWPAYPVDDYSYQLRVACFCPSAGIPVTVTVRDGEVTNAVYSRSIRGQIAGDKVFDSWLRITINDIIDEANVPKNAKVKVTWKEGQEYPSSVWIDRIENAIDDEIGYDIQNVQPA